MSKISMTEMPVSQYFQQEARDFTGAEIDGKLLYSGFMFYQVSTQLEARFEGILQKYNLNTGRFTLLQICAQSPSGVTSTDLSKALGITPATVSGLIKSMEADGYLERVTSTTDRRSFALVITAKGQQVLGEAKARWYPLINSFWRQFSAEEMAVLDGFVARMNSYLGTTQEM